MFRTIGDPSGSGTVETSLQNLQTSSQTGSLLQPLI
jgi:hypothetical protein